MGCGLRAAPPRPDGIHLPLTISGEESEEEGEENKSTSELHTCATILLKTIQRVHMHQKATVTGRMYELDSTATIKLQLVLSQLK